MKTYTTTSVGRTLRFSGPSTVAEYDTAAGVEGQCLNDAVQKVLNARTIPEWQEVFGTKIERYFNLTRAVDQTLTNKARAKNPAADSVPERWINFIRRVLALSEAQLAALVREQFEITDSAGVTTTVPPTLALLEQAACAQIVIDPKAQRRSLAVEVAFVTRAEDCLKRTPERIAATIATLKSKVPDFELEVDENTGQPDVESLALLYKAYSAAVFSEL